MVDFDHLWLLFRREPDIWINKNEWGRPLHHLFIFIIYAIIGSFFIGALFFRFLFGQGFGTLIVLNVVSFIFLKYSGDKLEDRLYENKRKMDLLNHPESEV